MSTHNLNTTTHEDEGIICSPSSKVLARGIMELEVVKKIS